VRLRAVGSETCPEHMPELDLALNTGLRLGELFGLVWENVNLARRVLTVPRTKNGETRHVPLNGAELAALEPSYGNAMTKRGRDPQRGRWGTDRSVLLV